MQSEREREKKNFLIILDKNKEDKEKRTDEKKYEDKEWQRYELKKHGRFSFKDPNAEMDKGTWLDAVIQITSERLIIKNKDPEDVFFNVQVKLEDIRSVTKKKMYIYVSFPINYLHIVTKGSEFYLTTFGKALPVDKVPVLFNKLFIALVAVIKQRREFIAQNTGQKAAQESKTAETMPLNREIPTVPTIICPQCGCEIPSDSSFCPNCGISC